MTDEEKAAIFIKRYWGTYTEAFRNETIPRLVKLIRDEREACAKIAHQETKAGKHWTRPEYTEGYRTAARTIEEKIYDRSS